MSPVPAKRPSIALGLVVCALALVSSGSAGPAAGPAASSLAFAVKVLVPGQPEQAASVVSSPPNASAFLNGFSAPGLSAGAITASTAAQPGSPVTAAAASTVAALSLFGGEITADGVSARARSLADAGSASGDTTESSVTNLVALGQPVAASPNLRVQLGDWGTLTVLEQGVDHSPQKGAPGYRGFVTGLDVRLTADHGGLPAGSQILVGYAEAAAVAGPPAPATTAPTTSTAPRSTSTTTPTGTIPLHVSGGPNPPPLGEKGQGKTPRRPPPKLTPKLTAGRYVFPVYGAVAYGDSFGAPRGDIESGWHHGADIFGQLGQPLLAVTDGVVYSVGWNEIGGNRLWLRDGQGNEFYYAHLSAFSTLAVDGAHVNAGDVIGFMGNSGDATTTPYHLHFEVHPVSLLYLGYDGAVNPTTYLEAWQRLEDVDFPAGAAWAPFVRGGNAPQPGAILLGVSDISRADGLDPASLRRARVATRTD
jgi:murein DD-endopeptidase MepM/ murein hydrolase activator NlpD